MSRIPDQSKFSLWSQGFNRFHNSGLSIARFCAQENIPTHSFYYWAKRVGPRSQHRQTRAIDSAVDLAISPPGQPVADSHDASSVMIHCNQLLELEVPAHCLDTIRAIIHELLPCGPGGDSSRSDMSPRSVGFQQVIVRSQLQSRRV